MEEKTKKRRSENKEKILGMNAGTANTRLVRMILFHILGKNGLDICYICNKKIKEYKNFTIEHKISWESKKDKDLYWDMDNISFSHKKCNISYRDYLVPPKGKNWCKYCRKFKPVNHFNKDVSRKYGLQNYCKYHNSILKKLYYKENSEKILKKQKEIYWSNFK